MGRKYNTELFVKVVSDMHPDLNFNNTIYVNPRIKVLYSCPKHGQREAYPYNLLKGCGCKQCASGCPKISKEKWVERFSKNEDFNNIEYSFLPNEFKADEKVKFSCNIHGMFMQAPKDHLKSSCPFCGIAKSATYNKNNPSGWSYSNWQKAADRSKYFDSFKVYFIKCWNDDKTETFYKIGKTYMTIKLRFRNKDKTKMPYNYEVIDTYIFDNAKDCSIFEKTLQKDNFKNKYLPLLFFPGMHECFSDLNASKNIKSEGIALIRQRSTLVHA